MNVHEQVEIVLDARYVNDMSPGHMGSRIMRFIRQSDQASLVVKYAHPKNRLASNDLAENVFAYSGLKKIGASIMLPKDIQVISIWGEKVLVMSDIGQTMAQRNGGVKEFNFLAKHLLNVLEKTRCTTSEDIADIGERETLRNIKRFLPKGSNICLSIAQSGENKLKKLAVMVLDFTPDNVSVNENGLSFIDPWRQRSYLGNPAISIGQFVTLARLYKMRDAKAGGEVLEGMAKVKLPKLLGTKSSVIERGLKLGATLQYVLSAYVRRNSEPEQSRDFLNRARDMWI
ncbi:MAG: hypothetical protein ABI430_02800 [Candidatus Taylorbacteria bacterium]